MSNDAPVLEAKLREPEGSRTARRMRRDGLVPGVVYGGEGDPVALVVGERDLRAALSGHSALIDLQIDGEKAQPVLVRDQQRHPVTGRIAHIDLIRVNLKVKVQASITIELIGAEESPGLKFGGLLENNTREVNVEVLPTAIPETITVDASALELGSALHISDLIVPEGVEILDDPATVIATVTASRLAQQTEREGDEGETEVVGEAAGDAAEASASGAEDGGEE
jgi:large subunit ribosomal protein L25